jgi:proteic killer suppression protein
MSLPLKNWRFRGGFGGFGVAFGVWCAASVVARVIARVMEFSLSTTLARCEASLPGNRLEALRGDRQRQPSIRINDQWRLCFVWRNGDAYEVEVADYH